MLRVAVTGLSGVIGTQLLPSLLHQPIKIIELYRQRSALTASPSVHQTHQVDIGSEANLRQVLGRLKTDVFLHLAAATHIDRCQQDESNQRQGVVWKTNVESTRLITEYCRQHQSRLVFLSTECVFDGKKSLVNEKTMPHPKNWYGVTKAMAEKEVRSLTKLGTIIRAAIAYHQHDQCQTMFGRIQQSFQRQKPFSVVANQYLTPTYTPDIVKAIITVINNQQLSGVFHISSNMEITPYQFSQVIAEHFGYDAHLAQPATMTEYLGSRRAAWRLRHASLDGKVTQKKLGYQPLTISEVLSHSLDNRPTAS